MAEATATASPGKNRSSEIEAMCRVVRGGGMANAGR